MVTTMENSQKACNSPYADSTYHIVACCHDYCSDHCRDQEQDAQINDLI